MQMDAGHNYDCSGLFAFFEEVYGQLLEIGRIQKIEEEIQRDLIHELFLSFYEKRISLDQLTNPKSYIFTSYKRKIIDHYRQSARFQLDDGWMNHPLTLIPSPETSLMEKESIQEWSSYLKKAYAQLPERCKKVIFLKYYKGLDTNQIQQETGWSVQSIYNYLSIGLKALKRALEENPRIARGGVSILILLIFMAFS